MNGIDSLPAPVEGCFNTKQPFLFEPLPILSQATINRDSSMGVYCNENIGLVPRSPEEITCKQTNFFAKCATGSSKKNLF